MNAHELAEQLIDNEYVDVQHNGVPYRLTYDEVVTDLCGLTVEHNNDITRLCLLVHRGNFAQTELKEIGERIHARVVKYLRDYAS